MDFLWSVELHFPKHSSAVSKRFTGCSLGLISILPVECQQHPLVFSEFLKDREDSQDHKLCSSCYVNDTMIHLLLPHINHSFYTFQ